MSEGSAKHQVDAKMLFDGDYVVLLPRFLEFEKNTSGNVMLNQDGSLRSLAGLTPAGTERSLRSLR